VKFAFVAAFEIISVVFAQQNCVGHLEVYVISLIIIATAHFENVRQVLFL